MNEAQLRAWMGPITVTILNAGQAITGVVENTVNILVEDGLLVGRLIRADDKTLMLLLNTGSQWTDIAPGDYVRVSYPSDPDDPYVIDVWVEDAWVTPLKPGCNLLQE